MIKRSISSILLLIIFVQNSGCYSTQYLFKEDINELSKGDKIKVIMHDGNTYHITVGKIEGTEIHGIETTGLEQTVVIIRTEDIKIIETENFETGRTILWSLAGIAIVAAVGFLILMIGFATSR